MAHNSGCGCIAMEARGGAIHFSELQCARPICAYLAWSSEANIRDKATRQSLRHFEVSQRWNGTPRLYTIVPRSPTNHSLLRSALARVYRRLTLISTSLFMAKQRARSLSTAILDAHLTPCCRCCQCDVTGLTPTPTV